MSNLPHNKIGGAEIYNRILYESFTNINFIEIPFLKNYEDVNSLYENVNINDLPKKMYDKVVSKSYVFKGFLNCNFKLIKRLFDFLINRQISKLIFNELDIIVNLNNIHCIIWATSIFFNKKFIKKYKDIIFFVQHQNPYHYFYMYYFDYQKSKQYKKFSLVSFFTNKSVVLNFNFFKYIKNIICFDQENKKIIETKYKNKEIIPINIPSKFNLIETDQNLNKIYDFIMPIRLEKQKNIECIAEFAKLYPNKKFVILGNGSLDYLLKNIPNILLIHAVEKDALLEYYKQSKFMLLFSYFEGFPLVMAEALSLGLPCISPNTFPSATYLIGDKFERGFIFDLKSSNKFSEINKFIDSCDYYQLSNNALNFAKQDLTMEEFKNKWENVFKGIK